MRKLLLAILLCAMGGSAALAQTNPICPYNYVTPAAVTSTTVLIAQNQRFIRICKVTFNVVQGGSAVNFSLIAGTGATCGVSTSLVTQVYTGVASVTQIYSESVDSSIGWFAGSNVAVCLSLSGAPTSATAQVWYGLY